MYSINYAPQKSGTDSYSSNFKDENQSIYQSIVAPYISAISGIMNPPL